MGDAAPKIRTTTFAAMKAEGRRISVMTAYDALTGGWVEAAGVEAVLVGDSLGNTALGLPGTIGVTMEMMVHHTAAVARAVRRALIIGDMPFMSYKVTPEEALRNAGRLVREGGAEAVKLEGGMAMAPTIRRIVAAGIPVMGHIGLLPQSEHAQGGFRVQGRGEASAQGLLEDARAVEEAGAFSVVLEGIVPEVAAKITASLSTPTIGIGSGPGCDGQVLVLSDVLGMGEGRVPSFVKQYADVHGVAIEALENYTREVRKGRFPAREQDA